MHTQMVNLYKDPAGENVFTSRSEPPTSAPRTAARGSIALNEIRSKDETIAKLRAKLKEYEVYNYVELDYF